MLWAPHVLFPFYSQWKGLSIFYFPGRLNLDLLWEKKVVFNIFGNPCLCFYIRLNLTLRCLNFRIRVTYYTYKYENIVKVWFCQYIDYLKGISCHQNPFSVFTTIIWYLCLSLLLFVMGFLMVGDKNICTHTPNPHYLLFLILHFKWKPE